MKITAQHQIQIKINQLVLLTEAQVYLISIISLFHNLAGNYKVEIRVKMIKLNIMVHCIHQNQPTTQNSLITWATKIMCRLAQVPF